MKHSNVILKPIGMPTSWCGIQTIGETAKALLAPLQRDRQRGRERFMGHQRPRMTYSPRWLWCALTRWVEHHSKLCRGKHPYEAARCAPVPESRPPGRSLQQREMVAFGEMVSTRWSGIQWQLNLPSSVLLMTILWLSSRFHLIDGSGLPFALQRRVTLSPSRTMTSLEVSASSMFGGTVREEREKEGSRVLLFMPAKHKLKASSSSSRAWFKCKNFCILATSWAPWKWNQQQRRHCESHTPYQKIIYNMVRSEKCKEIFPSSSVWLPSQSWSKLSLGFWKGQTRWQSCVTHD